MTYYLKSSLCSLNSTALQSQAFIMSDSLLCDVLWQQLI